MSLIIYIAHTGLRLEVDSSSYSSLDELRSWITKQCSILESHQIILTARGKLVRNGNSTSEKEYFVYDRVLFTFPEGHTRAGSPEVPIPELFAPKNPPASLADQGNLQSWQTLFQERRQWATRLSHQTTKLLGEVNHYSTQAAVIQRATAIASERLKQNTGGLQEKYAKAKNWVDGTLQEPKFVSENLKDAVGRLGLIGAEWELLRFFRPPGSTDQSISKAARLTLRDLVNTSIARDAASRAVDASQWLEKQTSKLGSAYEDLLQDIKSLVEDSQNDFAALDSRGIQNTADSLSDEIQAIVNKIGLDCEAALSPHDNARNVSSLSRVASHHTHNLLPSLVDTAKDISELLQRTVQQRNESQTLALQTMQKISLLEVRFADIQSGISNLGIDEEEDRFAFDIMNFIASLPAMYASLICEAVRRREWSEKMMSDSSTLAEEMATHKEDEERRRSKWSKGLQDYLQPNVLESKALDVDVNLTNTNSTWPKLSRKDIDNYAGILRSLGGYESILEDIADQVKALDAPSKQQVRRTNAFRNGSIHDAAYGRQSLLLRGDDELISVLQTDKTRLEDRLKGSESRIRKLEDLLHRQSQMISKAPGSSPRHSLDRPPTSPVVGHQGLASPKGGQEAFSRHSSSSSRRVSGNYGSEEKALAQRIVRLETELASEKTKSAQGHEHMKTHEDLKLQVQEATSMKKDLMDNFNAQQVEFDGERRLFTEENRKLKMRIEEMEEEIDRLLGSNDNAKNGFDERVRAHENEVAKVQREAFDEAQRLQGQIDYLRNDYHTQRERAYELERQVQSQGEELLEAKRAVYKLEEDLKSREIESEEHHRSLRAIFSELSEDGAPSDNFNTMLKEAEALSRKAVNHLQDVRVALDSAQTANSTYREKLSSNEEAVASLRRQHEADKNSMNSLRESLDAEKARFASLEAELMSERKELAELRSKLSAGESGSEVLKARVAEEEEKSGALRMELVSVKTRLDQLEKGLSNKTNDLESLKALKQNSEHMLFERAQRAEQISVLLFSQTDRLTHLLEHIGFNIIREEDSMIIQRAPRQPASSFHGADQSQTINRSLSGPVPKTTGAPPDYIHWALSQEEELEISQFNAFLQESRAFDMDAFSDAVVKRIKDTEHFARKWQREAKNYREKFHRAHFESQNKIAFRSFREGDLALFLPTRNTAPNQRSWAAFNVGAPHYFLREQDSHRLSSRDWLLARISKVEERVVDLSRSESSLKPLPSTSSLEDDNPFGLSDGLRWYFLDAAEEKLGAPSTPGLAKSTVASAHVDAAGSIQRKKEPDDGAVTRTLTKSLDSRRSSGNSRKSLIGAATNPIAATAHVESTAAGGTASSSLRTAESALDNTRIKNVSSKSSIPEEGETRGEPEGPTANLREGNRSPAKSKVWDSLLSLDLSLEGKKKK